MLYVLTLLLALGWAWAPPLGAKPSNCLTGKYAGLMIEQVSELAPPIAEQPSVVQGNRTFFQRQLEVTFQPGQYVWLASTPDGNGMLATDDQVQITFLPSGHSYRHDFRNQSRTAIVPIAPIELTSLFTVGNNTITFTTQDLMGPAFRTTPYYILRLAPCARRGPVEPSTPTAMATPTVTPSPTAIRVLLPIAMHLDTPTPTATLVPPTETPQPPATSTATPTPPRVGAAPPVAPNPTTSLAPPSSGSPKRWALLWLALVSSVAGIVLLVVSRQPHPHGEVELYQEAIFVTSLNLGQTGKQVVTVGKRGDLRLFDPESPDVIARFTAHRNTEGEIETILEMIAQGPMDLGQTLVMHHEDDVSLGMLGYRLRYLNYATSEVSLSEGEQYV